MEQKIAFKKNDESKQSWCKRNDDSMLDGKSKAKEWKWKWLATLSEINVTSRDRSLCMGGGGDFAWAGLPKLSAPLKKKLWQQCFRFILAQNICKKCFVHFLQYFRVKNKCAPFDELSKKWHPLKICAPQHPPPAPVNNKRSLSELQFHFAVLMVLMFVVLSFWADTYPRRWIMKAPTVCVINFGVIKKGN